MSYTISHLSNTAKGDNITNKLASQNEYMRYNMHWAGFEGSSQCNMASRQHCKMR